MKKKINLKIKLKFGDINITTRPPYPTICRYCKKKIYLVNVGGKNRMPISKEGDDWIFHNLICNPKKNEKSNES